MSDQYVMEEKKWAIVGVALAVAVICIALVVSSGMKASFRAARVDLSVTVTYHGPRSGLPDTLRIAVPK